jgi:pimeloyl-ACP methyl ester carboxylesterase
MPFADHQEIQIYYEVEGQGPPIILAHGLTGSTTFWRGYGYVDQLRDKFTVVLFDARGHGNSDKPHEATAYDHRLMMGDELAVLDALGIDRAHYWGYSMGGAIGLGLAQHHPERLVSLTADGTNPCYSPDESDKPSPLLEILRRGVTEGADAVVEGMRAWAGSITPHYEERLRSLDPQAMVAYLEPSRRRPSFTDALPQMNVPCLLYAGERDGNAYQNGPAAAQQMPDARFVSLLGLNHVGASAAVDLIMLHVLAFLTGVAASEPGGAAGADPA